jgi:hypothetical protein
MNASAPNSFSLNRKVEHLSLWWGEATDEPAREDARPTDRFMAPMRVRSWRSRLSMNLVYTRIVLECGGKRSATPLSHGL